MTESLFGWHIHHEILLEPATEPIQHRIDYIRAYKPAKEVPIRLRLLRPAYNLPESVIQAFADLNKSVDALDLAVEAYALARTAYYIRSAQQDISSAQQAYRLAHLAQNKARLAYDQTLVDNKAEIDRLHKEQCEPDCPWNGRTIFPYTKEDWK